MTDLALDTRDGLPDALRVLAAAYPRDGWTRDPGFDALIAFWLDRHMMFRRIMADLNGAAEAMLDRRIDAQGFGKQVSRYGGMFVNGLHEHHTIEDVHYFPKLQAADDRVARGFDILDADHHALDGHLSRFVDSANAVLTRLDDPDAVHAQAGAFHGELLDLQRLLDRHLIDEEDLVVPVILKYGSGTLGL